ncbi:MAG: PorT family protein [Saprospiraceae bacterium]|nr:PorT family protein [Saprospiraceae bacterium]
MKKIHLFLILAFLITEIQSVTSQVSFRPQVGINSSNLTGDEGLFEFDNGTGYQIGVDFQFGNQLYIQPGLQLEFLKNQVMIASTGGNDLNEYKRTGLRIPLMIGYRLGYGADDAFNFRLFTGPNALIQLSSKTDDDNFIDEDTLKDLVFGWNIGVGIDIPLFFVDIGYQLGISEVFDDQNSAPRNNLFYVSAGIRANL